MSSHNTPTEYLACVPDLGQSLSDYFIGTTRYPRHGLTVNFFGFGLLKKKIKPVQSLEHTAATFVAFVSNKYSLNNNYVIIIIQHHWIH